MKNILLAIFILSIYSLQSCTQQGECEGRIIIENSLPDITLQLEDGEHTINLTSPPVFKHTADKPLGYFTQVIEGVDYLDSNIKENGTNQFTLVLSPKETGTAIVAVEVGDNCLEDVKEEFTVTIE